MENGNQLVTTDPDSQPVAVRQPGSMVEGWREQSAAVMSSIDVKTQEGKQDFLRATGTADRLMKHCVGQTLTVRDWLLHEVKLTDQNDGESYPALRLVLILEDGSTVSTTSEPFMGGWRHVVQMFGFKTYAPPLEITVKAVKAKTVGEYLQIASVGIKASAVKAGKKP